MLRVSCPTLFDDQSGISGARMEFRTTLTGMWYVCDSVVCVCCVLRSDVICGMLCGCDVAHDVPYSFPFVSFLLFFRSGCDGVMAY